MLQSLGWNLLTKDWSDLLSDFQSAEREWRTMVDERYVLVIDDEPDFLDYVTIVLSANGYRVRTAGSGGEGLEIMRQDPPDLVMLDLMISYALDGWKVSRQMQSDSRLRDIPVLIVSAIVSGEDDDLLASGKGGRVDAFMSKPLEPSALLSCVAGLMRTS